MVLILTNIKAKFLDVMVWTVLVVQNVVFFFLFFSLLPLPPFPSHRVLRHTAVICTSRSLHIRATVCRSNALGDEEGRGDNMLLFVDVENINTVSPYFY